MKHILEHRNKLNSPQHSTLLCFLLKLLKYKYYSNGIEGGYIKGNMEYWCHDDGSYSRSRYE